MKKGNSPAFTLIELLVVVAIIGILASIVLASLNSARDKGKAAAIKSNLRNAIAEAELSYDDNGNYSQACTDIQAMLDAVTNSGAISSCYSYNNVTYNDVYTRWGASALVGTDTPIEAYSSSQRGNVAWFNQGTDIYGQPTVSDSLAQWSTANTACATAGGRLPTIEELKTLSDAMYIASGSSTYIPPGFRSDRTYWSANAVSSNPGFVYVVNVNTGSISIDGELGNRRFHCVL